MKQRHMGQQQKAPGWMHRAHRSPQPGIAERSVTNPDAVVHLSDTLRSGCPGDVRHRVRSLLRRGARVIVLDLSRVSTIDAAGIGEVVRAYNMTLAMQGELRIVRARKLVRELLERAGLFDRLTS